MDTEKFIGNWLKNIPEFNCNEEVKKYRPTDYGKRFVDNVICQGFKKIAIEIKTGDAPYMGTLQHEKDLFLVASKEFSEVIVIRLKSFAEYFGK